MDVVIVIGSRAKEVIQMVDHRVPRTEKQMDLLGKAGLILYTRKKDRRKKREQKRVSK